jgi:hypothetical protein
LFPERETEIRIYLSRENALPMLPEKRDRREQKKEKERL